MASAGREVQLTGSGVGQLRTIERVDGKQIVERLDAMNSARRLDQLLRGIDKFLDLGDLRQHLAPFYSRAGRPAQPGSSTTHEQPAGLRLIPKAKEAIEKLQEQGKYPRPQ